MICPLCKNELAITASRTRADRDDRPDLATRVWVEQELRCRNRGCAGFGRVLRIARVYLIGGPDPGEETVSDGSLDGSLDESLEEGPGGESAGPEESLDGSSGGENAAPDAAGPDKSPAARPPKNTEEG